jgi:AAA+ superfamily predicted ATPase
MRPLSALPGWLQRLDAARASGAPGAILDFNTSDRMLVTVGQAPAAPHLLRGLAAHLYGQGEPAVACYSTSRGFELLRRPDDSEVRNHPWSRVAPGPDSNLRLVLDAYRELGHSEAGRGVLIVDYAEHAAPAVSAGGGTLTPEQVNVVETLHQFGLDDRLRRGRVFLVLVVRDGALHRLVSEAAGYTALPVPLPCLEQRDAFIAYLSRAGEASRMALGRLSAELDQAALARMSGGMRLVDIEHLFRATGAEGRRAITLEDIRARKRDAMRELCRDLVEFVEPQAGFESVAGCNHAVSYFTELKLLWQQGSNQVPQGVLLVGVPGVGKSHLVKAVAKELALPCLVMRSVREMWVGQSERNLERVLQVVDSMAPCILWTDELDQNGGGRRGVSASGDSGTSERMLARLLEFFGSSDRRGRVLWIATTNRADLLDVAMLDRFAVKIPFVHPSRHDRALLLPILAAQVGGQLAPSVDVERLAGRPEIAELSVRALQEIVAWAGVRQHAAGHGAEPISEAALASAIGDFCATHDPVEHERIALSALRVTSFNSLLPWSREPTFSVDDWPSYVGRVVDRDTGRLNSGALLARLAELSGRVQDDGA